MLLSASYTVKWIKAEQFPESQTLSTSYCDVHYQLITCLCCVICYFIYSVVWSPIAYLVFTQMCQILCFFAEMITWVAKENLNHLIWIVNHWIDIYNILSIWRTLYTILCAINWNNWTSEKENITRLLISAHIDLCYQYSRVNSTTSYPILFQTTYTTLFLIYRTFP